MAFSTPIEALTFTRSLPDSAWRVRDEDNARRTDRRTVDGGRGGILQHGDRLDVLDHVGGVGHAVDHDQHAVARRWIVVVALRSAAADRERRLAHRVTAGLLDRHARHAALEQRPEVRGAAARRLVDLDRLHGHREVLLALRAVADGHDLADHHGILGHRDVDLRAVHHGDILRLVADVGVLQHGIARHGDLVTALHVGRHAVGRTLLDDRRADERILTRVDQTARNRYAVLRPGRKSEHAAQQAHQKSLEDSPSLPRKSQIHFHRVKVNNLMYLVVKRCVSKLLKYLINVSDV